MKNILVACNMTASHQDFEAQQILADKIHEGHIYYLIRWKVTVTSTIQPFLELRQAEIKNRFCKNGVHRITWKDSWMPVTALQDTCDELLSAYLHLKLYKC